MRRALPFVLAALALGGCGSDSGSSSTTGSAAQQVPTVRPAHTGHPSDLTARQARSAARACAPIRRLPAAPASGDVTTTVAVAATLEQPTLATGAQLDRIAQAARRVNRPLLELAQGFQQLAAAYSALATVSHGNHAVVSALQQRALAAARVVALEARALGLRACVPRLPG
jgi:hypothetical protein